MDTADALPDSMSRMRASMVCGPIFVPAVFRGAVERCETSQTPPSPSLCIAESAGRSTTRPGCYRTQAGEDDGDAGMFLDIGTFAASGARRPLQSHISACTSHDLLHKVPRSAAFDWPSCVPSRHQSDKRVKEVHRPLVPLSALQKEVDDQDRGSISPMEWPLKSFSVADRGDINSDEAADAAEASSGCGRYGRRRTHRDHRCGRRRSREPTENDRTEPVRRARCGRTCPERAPSLGSLSTAFSITLPSHRMAASALGRSRQRRNGQRT